MTRSNSKLGTPWRRGPTPWSPQQASVGRPCVTRRGRPCGSRWPSWSAWCRHHACGATHAGRHARRDAPTCRRLPALHRQTGNRYPAMEYPVLIGYFAYGASWVTQTLSGSPTFARALVTATDITASRGVARRSRGALRWWRDPAGAFTLSACVSPACTGDGRGRRARRLARPRAGRADRLGSDRDRRGHSGRCGPGRAAARCSRRADRPWHRDPSSTRGFLLGALLLRLPATRPGCPPVLHRHRAPMLAVRPAAMLGDFRPVDCVVDVQRHAARTSGRCALHLAAAAARSRRPGERGSAGVLGAVCLGVLGAQAAGAPLPQNPQAGAARRDRVPGA